MLLRLFTPIKSPVLEHNCRNSRNIYAPLVSSFIDGKYEGILASSWDVNETGQVWKFHLRHDLTFDDGSPVTPEAVLANFRRILWLTKEEGLVLNSLLPEVKTWESYHKPLKSISIEGNDLVFHFNKRPISFFEAISQPIYGIANPKCFDTEGKWKDPFCTSGSGQYKVVEHTSSLIKLKRRGIFNEVDKAPENVEIHFPASSADNVVKALMENRGDLTVEHSFALTSTMVNQIKDKGLRIKEEPPVRMHFVHINSNRGPLRSKELRQSIRDTFLVSLKKNPRYQHSGIEVDPSFIPNGGVGYRKFDIRDHQPSVFGKNETIEVLLYPFSGDPDIQQSVEETLLNTLKLHKLTPKVVRYPERFEAFNRMRKGDFDIIVRGTGILVNNPYGDLRMMFMSKLGAKIPDGSGHIPTLIEKAELEENAQKRSAIVETINSSLFNESEIITFAHSRLYYIYQQTIDLSRLSLFSDPIEFRAVQWISK